MFAEQSSNRMSVADYMRHEIQSDVRHEYVDGEVYMMSGAKTAHVDVSNNVSNILYNQLARRGCFSAAENQLVRTGDGNYFYPDAYALCGERILTADPVPALTNFVLIVEILSESTERFDRGKKFRHYRSTPTLGEYILIDPDSVSLEIHRIQPDGSWMVRQVTDLDAVVRLESVPVELPVRDIYLNVF